jgi:hypothetical protein
MTATQQHSNNHLVLNDSIAAAARVAKTAINY